MTKLTVLSREEGAFYADTDSLAQQHFKLASRVKESLKLSGWSTIINAAFAISLVNSGYVAVSIMNSGAVLLLLFMMAAQKRKIEQNLDRGTRLLKTPSPLDY